MADGNMIPLLPQSDGRLAWGNGVISMLFDVTGDSPVRLANVAGRGMAATEGGLSGADAVVERDARPTSRYAPPTPDRKTTVYR